MTDKEQIQHLIDKNNKLEAELISLKTKATGWFEDISELRNSLTARNADLKLRKEVHVNWELKKKIILFLQKTQSLEAYDAMTPNQIAHRAATFIEKILGSKQPPLLAITNELQINTREPD
jgi:hypothetical protein